ncbi:hypothetical protein B7H01_11110 [Pandoraea apista]|nr:hypothetical protein B7H01_11110 [Pandoraea apista]
MLTIWHRNCERLVVTFVDDMFCANSERARTVAVRKCFKSAHDVKANDERMAPDSEHALRAPRGKDDTR